MQNNIILEDNKIYFDLFSLHKKEDKDPRSWIFANGKNLEREVKVILEDLYKNYTLKDIINEVLSNIGIKIKILNEKNFDIGKEIKNKRIKLGLGFKKICELTGTAGKNFRLVEEGKYFFSCNKLKRICKLLGELDCIEINCNKKDLCSKKLCLILDSLNYNKDFPLILIKELLNIWKDKYKIQNKEFVNKKIDIIKSIDTLRLNQHCSQEIKALKELNQDVAKIIGAFCTDGNLTYPDMIRWEEEHLSNMQALSKWIENCFRRVEINPTKRNRNSFFLRFRSKVVTMYLTTFFDIKPGNKTYTVRAPLIIRNANFNIKKAFAKGAMTFEGSVDFYGRAYFGVVSRKLTYDIYNIINNEINNIRITSTHYIKNRYGKTIMHNLVFGNLTRKEKEIMVTYFEEDTIKWKKIKENLYGFNKGVKNFKEAIVILENYFSKAYKLDGKGLLKLVNKSRTFDVYNIINITKTKRAPTAKNLNLFVKFNILSKGYKNRRMVYEYNNNISDWRLPSIEF